MKINVMMLKKVMAVHKPMKQHQSLPFIITENNEVKIMGLGTFSVKHKKERVGRNPKTGKEAVIEARNVISFRPAKNLKSSLN